VQTGEWAGVQDAAVLEGKTVTIQSVEGALVTALRGNGGLSDESRVASFAACETTGCVSPPCRNCVPPTEYALNLRQSACSGVGCAQPRITVTLEGFTIYNFGFSGAPYWTTDPQSGDPWQVLPDGTTVGTDYSDYWGAPEGGAFRLDYAQLTIRKCILHSNKARRGGVVYMERSKLELDTVIVRDNFAHERGGGIYSIVPDCGNTAGCFDVMASRTLFQGNVVGGEGGGLYAYDTKVKMTNVVFTGNDAGSNDDGIGSTIEQRVDCCQGLAACTCGGGGMVLKGAAHTFEDVVAEDNSCTGESQSARASVEEPSR